MITTISDYIKQRIEEGVTPTELGDKLNITSAMISKYKADIGYKPSYNVALKVYEADAIALHPFSEEGLKYELARTK